MRLRSRTVLVVTSMATIACASCATIRPSAPALTPAGVRFTLQRPDAMSVAVAGDFNEWSATAHPLARERTRGLWTAVVQLPPGEHLFMYVVNGTQWMTPPLAEDYVDDGFGSRNGVVIVRPDER